jgi:hypothetical protein
LRRLIILAFLLIAAPAQAAPLNELPFQPRPGAATCLRATATPGTLAILGPITQRTSATDLLANGTTRTDRVRLGALVDCAAVAADPGGAAVIAGGVRRGPDRARLRVVARDPGGAFGAPVALGSSAIIDASVAAAVSPSGHAVVAWTQRRGDPFGDRTPVRIVAARRAPGGTFGPPVALTAWRPTEGFGGPDVEAGIDAAGNATVAWLLPAGRFGERQRAAVARAAPGAPFSAQRLARHVDEPSRVALAVAPDGSSLLAFDGIEGVQVFERRPADARYTAVLSSRGDRPVSFDRSPVVAVRNGGGGLVAWRTETDTAAAGVTAAVRATAGAFGRPRVVARGVEGGGSFGEAFAVVVGGDRPLPPEDVGNAALRAALAPDGRAILAWGDDSSDLTRASRMRVATGSLATGFGPPQQLGGPIRDVNGVAALLRADGRMAAAWTDNAGGGFFQRGKGRLHLAVEGAPELPEPARPGLRVRVKRTQHLLRSQGIVARASCVRACDLRAAARTRNSEPIPLVRTLRAGGTAVLHLGAFQVHVAHQRRVRIVVTATAPGGRLRSTVSRHVVVVRRIPPPVPALLDVRARRSGRAIVVTWHTARPVGRAYFVVEGRRSRTRPANDPELFGSVYGEGETSFEVRLTPRGPASVHWVVVRAVSIDGARVPRRVVVPVAG